MAGLHTGMSRVGSAGMRNRDTTGSRKGVPDSLPWGVDFSNVPITVMQRRNELEA